MVLWMTHHLTLVRMAIITKFTINKCWSGCGENGTLLQWWEYELIKPLWRSMHAWVLSCFSCVWLWDSMDYSPPGSSVHGILQSRMLERVSMTSSRGSCWPRNWTCVSCIYCIAGRFFTTEPPRKPGEQCRGSLKKLTIELPWDPAVLLLGIYPEKTIIQKDICAPMFISALFTIARIWNQPKCASTEEWMNKMWYLYTMEYYSAIKNEICCLGQYQWI